MPSDLVVVRGAGDIATGTIYRLVRCGFQVVVLEIGEPTVIRRTVAFASAVFEGAAKVEGMEAVRAAGVKEALRIVSGGRIPVLVDPDAQCLGELKPTVVVDAILAKRNLGTRIDMADIVVGLGPGFTAGEDVHAVVETNRGHHLGTVILSGSTAPDTGIPGVIGGYGKERVIYSPAGGRIRTSANIGDTVKKGEIVAHVEEVPVFASLDGVLRGLIHDGLTVKPGMKIGDVDPRNVPEHCFTISDKARAIAGGVLEAILYLRNACHG